jgi:very-short-patch-repair endonuclease
LDGRSHHFEETMEKDRIKETRLNELGLNVLRFPDEDVFRNINNVLRTIETYVEGFERMDLRAFDYVNTPLNPLSRGWANTPLNPL